MALACGRSGGAKPPQAGGRGERGFHLGAFRPGRVGGSPPRALGRRRQREPQACTSVEVQPEARYVVMNCVRTVYAAKDAAPPSLEAPLGAPSVEPRPQHRREDPGGANRRSRGITREARGARVHGKTANGHRSKRCRSRGSAGRGRAPRRAARAPRCTPWPRRRVRPRVCVAVANSPLAAPQPSST